MVYRLCLALLLALGTGWAQPSIPNTPAGRMFNAWLDAFNSGDQAQMEAWYHKYQPAIAASDVMGFRNQTGGFELLKVPKSEPLQLEVLVKERNSDRQAIGMLRLSDSKPPKVEQFWLRAIPPGASVSATNFSVDAATRTQVIESIISDLNESYVSAELAKKMADALRAQQKQGAYSSVTDGAAFAAMLTKNLQTVSHDKHLRVDFSPVPMPKPPPHPSAADIARFRNQMLQMNCGFKKVEILPGGVGYLKFDMFADAEVCGPTAAAAMNFLANARAIIIDLRDNGGGQPQMVTFICSYLFDKPTHLNDLWQRKDDKTHQYWTLPYVPGKRLPGVPVYVLTSHRTFSGAEEFAYDLQMQKRATIVGETTGGGAHTVAGHWINSHFMVGVPNAKAINPVSKTDWEGTGVVPEVKVPAADALSTAEKLAEKKLASK
jgi:retinol-binding protein 3